MSLLLLLLLLLLLQDKNTVFVGTFGALAIMTVISVALGQVSGGPDESEV
jgi:putative Ca2+/H+ antiporter (TMEM165/GDT1 family)